MQTAGKTVKEALTEKIAVIGEKLNIRRFEKIVSDGCIVSYIHGGGRIGVLVEAETDVVNDEIRDLPEERGNAGCGNVSQVCIPRGSSGGLH